jgi:hypothetical protein
MNWSNYKPPHMATNPPLPNSVYEKMREQEWHDEEIEKEEQQIALLVEQNKLLKEQNQALKESNDASNKELKKSKCLNYFMATIAFLTLVATILMPLLVK